MKLKIKKGDMVECIAGSEKGKRGNVLEVDAKGLRIKVQNLKMMTHFDRKEGILKKEGFLDYSNVKLIEKVKAAKTKKKKQAQATP